MSATSGDGPLSGVRVYTDLNANNAYDDGEFFALSSTTGSYTIITDTGGAYMRETEFQVVDYRRGTNGAKSAVGDIRFLCGPSG